jgi:hypothetical protein
MTTPELPGRADITVVMITADRSPKRNYLRETIDNLKRGGVFESERLRSFTLLLGQPIKSLRSHAIELWSGGQVVDVQEAKYAATVCSLSHPVIPTDHRLLPCENAGRALILGAKLASAHPQGWVVFLEDDIDVCADFLDSVGRWLDRHGSEPHNLSALYSFGCSYPQISYAGGEVWCYPPFSFYGSQAIALRPQYAQAIGTFISSNPQIEHHDSTEEHRLLSPAEYDLMISHWAASSMPGHILSASIPSFVQHIGMDSSLSDRPFCHTFPSWPGREWSHK